MSDYPMLISNKLHSFRNFALQTYEFIFVFADIKNPLVVARGYIVNILLRL